MRAYHLSNAAVSGILLGSLEFWCCFGIAQDVETILLKLVKARGLRCGISYKIRVENWSAMLTEPSDGPMLEAIAAGRELDTAANQCLQRRVTVDPES